MRFTKITASILLTGLAIAIGSCAGSGVTARPARTSPLSPEAEEAPTQPVATSLTQDPLAQEPATSDTNHAGHHGHDHSVTPSDPHPQPESSPDAGSAATEYVCPMHPDVHQSGPGRCPRCGMNLVPTTTGSNPDAGPATEHHHDGHAH